MIHERMNHWSVLVTIYYPMTNDPGSIAVADPEGERRGRLPLLKKKDREREKGGGGVFRPSIKHISMHSFAC